MNNKRKTVVAFLMVLFICIAGCGGQTVTSVSKTDSQENSMESPFKDEKEVMGDDQQKSADRTQESSKDLLVDCGVRQDIMDAIRSSNLISGSNFYIDNEGNIHFMNSNSGAKNAYAYFGRNIVGLFSGESLLAVDSNGILYEGNRILSRNANIRDIWWEDENVDKNYYMLSRDGKGYYEDGKSLVDTDERYLSMCRSGDSTIFFTAEGIGTPKILPYDDSAIVPEEMDLSGWKNIVVAAGLCTESNNKQGRWRTIAGIDKDGRLFAVGRDAEDILAMGELKYISMWKRNGYGNIIAGLTTDGRLKFAGTLAERVPAEVKELTGITGVKAWDYSIFFRFEDGIVGKYSFISQACYMDVADTFVNTEGDFYNVEEGNVSLDTTLKKAVFEDFEKDLAETDLSTADEDGTDNSSYQDKENGIHLENDRILVDTESVQFILGDEFENEKHKTMGYYIVIRNKSNASIEVERAYVSINDWMSWNSVTGLTTHIGVGEEYKDALFSPKSFHGIETMDDVMKIEGVYKVNFSNGVRASYPISIPGRGGNGNTDEEDTYGKLALDNDMLSIRFSKPLEKEHGIGYYMIIQNKSDKYINVYLSHGIINGIEVSEQLIEERDIAPFKKSELYISARDKTSLDIHKSEDIESMEGEIRVIEKRDASNKDEKTNMYSYSVKIK